jgi:CRISPR-associated endonuclease/helicase Cas3
MLLANSQKHPLDQHLFAVGYLAKALLSQITDNTPQLLNAGYLAGCLHDLGKTDAKFQSWVCKNKQDGTAFDDGQHIETGKFSFENYPRHNEISLLLYRLLRNPAQQTVNQKSVEFVEHVIYWHHAKPIRKQDYDKLDCIYKPLRQTDFQDWINSCKQLVDAINNIAHCYSSEKEYLEIPALMDAFNPTVLNNIEQEDLPTYKHYREQNEVSDYRKNIGENAKTTLLRSAVITADRIISALSAAKLKHLIEEQGLAALASTHLTVNSNLQAAIQSSLNGFQQRYPNSPRNTQQTQTAAKLANIPDIAVLQGPAGCGKTKIALEWALNTQAQKIIWVCPRVQVCQGIYNDLIATDYLPNLRIEIHTGEFKVIHQSDTEIETDANTAFSGDVVITTIDQIINALLTHTQITSLLEFMSAHVVFDEYHEYIQMPAFNLLFAELLECKSLRGAKAHTLLVSATPNYLFLDELLDIPSDNVVRMDTFNNSRYQIAFDYFDETNKDASNPLYAPQPPQSFVISNTATTAQLSYLQNEASGENSLLLHGKFTRSDKQRVFANLMTAFKQHGTQQYGLLRSGPVVQASLNISCFNMVSEITHAENWLQRLGRLDRFGENSQSNRYTIAVPQSITINKANGNCANWLKQQHSFESAKAWWQYLQQKLQSVDTVTLAEIYTLYEDFYNDDKAQQAVREDLQNALKASVKLIKAKVLDPVNVPNRRKTDDAIIRIKKNSLRGDNRFVQMAVCEVVNGGLTLADRYAYQETPENLDYGSLTLSVDEIQGYGDSRNSPLVFMAKKHHNIKADVKKSYNDAALLNTARSPEFPIYLSYTPSDLAIKQVAETNLDCATYYVVGQHQAIGMMPFKHLKALKDKT